MASSLNGTGVTFSNGSTQSVAWPGNTGTVTSVATGNGLAGGTITSSGTLTLGSVAFNTVGAYVHGYSNAGGSFTSGNTYAAGSGVNQVQSFGWVSICGGGMIAVNNLSGTWRFMGATGMDRFNFYGSVFVRVA